MLRDWLRGRRARRRAELETRAPQVRKRIYEVVRALATPLVEQGRARLEWTEPDPTGDWSADGHVELVPTNQAATSVIVAPGPALVTLNVGPRGNAHEVVVDDEGAWRRALRVCLEAVIAGRYWETASPGRVSRQVVTMTFGVPEGDDIIVKHHELFELEPDEEPVPCERRFASYT